MNTKSKNAVQIKSRAPVRIDLAGGTVDIWPIYLLLDSPITINLAVDLFAETLIQATPTPQPGSVQLHSLDQADGVELAWDQLDHFEFPPGLDIHGRLLRHVAAASGIRGGWNLSITTRARSPAGAGLGGSSALGVSILGALAAWAEGKQKIDVLADGSRLIDIIKDVETQVIRVPAGLQDYYGAMFGGLQSIRWGVAHHRKWLKRELLQELHKRILLFYSGKSRNSGINNWDLFKHFIDRDPTTAQRFQKIVHATLSLEKSLLEGNWKQAAQSINDEWETRKTLAPGISTPEIDEAKRLLSKADPSVAFKICGAGGGGCFFAFFPDGDDRTRSDAIELISSSQVGKQIQSLSFSPAPEGLEVSIQNG